MERLNKLAGQVSPDTAPKLGYTGYDLVVLIQKKKKKKSTNNTKVWFHMTKLLSYKSESLACPILHLEISLIDIFSSLEVKKVKSET